MGIVLEYKGDPKRLTWTIEEATRVSLVEYDCADEFIVMLVAALHRSGGLTTRDLLELLPDFKLAETARGAHG